MRVRLGLQWRVLLLMIGGMTVILVVSVYFHNLVTRLLIEEDRYNTALSQTAVLATRIVSDHLIDHAPDLQDDLRLISSARPDMRQIDVYVAASSGLALVASSATDAVRLPALNQRSRDNEFGEMEHPADGVVTMEVNRGGERHWLITDTMHDGARTVYLSTLVRKAPGNALVERLGVRRDMVLAAAILVSSALCYVVFFYLFRRPARDIVMAMHAAQAGDSNARAIVRGDDEIGDIARGFNALMDELMTRNRERDRLMARISGFNDELQREVASATGELRSVNDALFHAQQRLARSERFAAMGQVAASLAHDIGTPLNSIGGHVELLARRYASDDDAQRRLGIIRDALRSIVTSVRALLSRANRRRAAPRAIDLGTVVSNTLRLVGPTLDAHRIEVSVDVRGGIPVVGDPERVENVLLNLINNALDAMPSGGRLALSARASDDRLMGELTVQDSGAGVPPDVTPHLFEPAWTSKPSGGGFGLASSRELMEEQGGALEFDPDGSPGACFVMRLPAAPAREAQRAVVQ
jgi:two-component system NtrC family sensor kinase